MPNRSKPPSSPPIRTHLQYLRRQRPDLLEREIVRDARIARVDLYHAVAPVVVDGVGGPGRQPRPPAREEVLDLAVVGEGADGVEGVAAAVDGGLRAVGMRGEALDYPYGGWWWRRWKRVRVCACAAV